MKCPSGQDHLFVEFLYTEQNLFDAKLKMRLFWNMLNNPWVESPLIDKTIKSASYSTFTAASCFSVNLQLRIQLNDALRYFLLLFKLF